MLNLATLLVLTWNTVSFSRYYAMLRTRSQIAHLGPFGLPIFQYCLVSGTSIISWSTAFSPLYIKNWFSLTLKSEFECLTKLVHIGPGWCIHSKICDSCELLIKIVKQVYNTFYIWQSNTWSIVFRLIKTFSMHFEQKAWRKLLFTFTLYFNWLFISMYLA